MEMIDKSILIISTPRTGSTSLLNSFIDKFNNEGWQVNKGVKVSEKYSIVGVSELWYKAKGKLYYRYSVAKELERLALEGGCTK